MITLPFCLLWEDFPVILHRHHCPFLCLRYWFPHILFSAFLPTFLLHLFVLSQASTNLDLFLESGGLYAIANLLSAHGQYLQTQIHTSEHV